MDSWTDQIVAQMLMAMDSTPVNPSLGQRYLSCLVCKNLTDLGETGLAILAEMKSRQLSVANLPNEGMIETCQNILKLYYTEAMFAKEEPDLDQIKKFDLNRSDTAFRIYRAIRNNIMMKPDSIKIQDAVKKRD